MFRRRLTATRRFNPFNSKLIEVNKATEMYALLLYPDEIITYDSKAEFKPQGVTILLIIPR